MKRTFILGSLILLSLWTLQAQVTGSDRRPFTFAHPHRGWFSLAEMRGGYGLGDVSVPYSHYNIGLTGQIGYQLYKNFTAGGGLGLSYYNGGLLAPLFLDFRYYFFPNGISPFLLADGGFLLNFSNFSDTKIYLSPAVGIRFPIEKNHSLNLSLGLHVQSAGGSRDSFVNFKAGWYYKFG